MRSGPMRVQAPGWIPHPLMGVPASKTACSPESALSCSAAITSPEQVSRRRTGSPNSEALGISCVGYAASSCHQPSQAVEVSRPVGKSVFPIPPLCGRLSSPWPASNRRFRLLKSNILRPLVWWAGLRCPRRNEPNYAMFQRVDATFRLRIGHLTCAPKSRTLDGKVLHAGFGPGSRLSRPGILRPGVPGIAAAHLGPHLRVGPGPERRQVIRHSQRPPRG